MKRKQVPGVIRYPLSEESLYDGEIKVMNVLWDKGPMSAKELSKELYEGTGWAVNTSYTVIRKLVEKGFIERVEPAFHCVPTISREDEQKKQLGRLVDKLFGGSRKCMISALLDDDGLSAEDIEEIRKLLDR